MHYNIFMNKVKEPAVKGMFYPNDSEGLKNQLKSFECKKVYDYNTRLVIVPHAGLIYSGQLAYQGISQLDRNIKNIFIFAPAHRASFEGLALSGYDEWKTPVGNISLNQQINKELEDDFKAKILDSAHENEHSIEIQIPIIQTLFQEIKIIPVLVGMENPNKITDIIKKYYNNKDFGFIISSDLSHFLTDERAKILDNKTAQMIETGNIQGFNYEQACGAVGICGAVLFANKNKYSLIRVNLINSSHVSNDKSRVVGYGSWILYEGEKNKFLKKHYSSYMLNLVKNVIKSRFSKEKIITNHTAVFDESGACFVTLKKHGNLRGCIGSIIAHRPLIDDLINHANNSAFKDPRFNPVEQNELDELKIDISLLSDPKPIEFSDEKDLLEKIVPYKDGIIIKDGNYQAVYLPSVWEEIPDKELFLKSLKMKAGMQPDHFSDTFEALRFYSEYIEE